MTIRRGGPIGFGVRLACGLTGGLIITLGVLAAIHDPDTPGAMVFLMLALGSLFLVPALLSGPRPSSRSPEAQERLTRRIALASRLLTLSAYVVWGWVTVSACIPKNRMDWRGSNSTLQVALLAASAAWLLGFLLRFFQIYYESQDEE